MPRFAIPARRDAALSAARHRTVLPVVGLLVILLVAAAAGFATTTPAAAQGPTAVPPAPTALPGPQVFAGTFGAYVAVADACSYYPLTLCDGSGEVQISERVAGTLAVWVGQPVRVEVTYEVCGSGIAGQPLTGAVATHVEPLEVECPQPDACLRLVGRVPDAAVQAALANPARVLGWLERCNPAVPASPLNGLRHNLSLRNPAVPYHPIFNHLVFRCSCP
jgi:hypothetical protein